MRSLIDHRARYPECLSKTKTMAFTRVELLAVLVTLFVLSTLCLPLLGQNRSLSERAVCANNLRSIGLAFESWGSDFGDQRPQRLPPSSGGSMVPGRPANAWEEYAFCNPHLASPRVLACPSDPRVKQASRWSTSSDGGFYNPGYRNNAVSYFLGLEADASFADSFLAGDSDIRVINSSVTCSATGVSNAALLENRGPNPVAAWTNRVHTASGNILFNDGRVEALSTSELRVAAARTVNDQGQCHILMPR